MDNWLTPWVRDGIAVGDRAGLIPDELWEALQREAAAVMQNPMAAFQSLAEARGMRTGKRFLRQWLGRRPSYAPDSIWAEVARQLTPLMSAYLEEPAVLRYYNLWDIAPSDAPPTKSQWWHRDHEAARIPKVFLYLAEVTDGAGPLTYAVGTHDRGAYAGQTPETFLEPDTGWIRATDAQMAALVPAPEWRVATGPAGTVVLADTAGYHKGGQATTTRRLCAVWQWTPAEAHKADYFHPFGPQP